MKRALIAGPELTTNLAPHHTSPRSFHLRRVGFFEEAQRRYPASLQCLAWLWPTALPWAWFGYNSINDFFIKYMWL